jgi:hypothetical protein
MTNKEIKQISKSKPKKSQSCVPLKELTNEKRSGLTVILVGRSRFQLFRLKFSNKSVQSSSCERPKTAQPIRPHHRPLQRWHWCVTPRNNPIVLESNVFHDPIYFVK